MSDRGFYYDQAFGADDEWSGANNKPKVEPPKDPIVVTAIQTLKLSDDEILIVRYPTDSDAYSVSKFANAFKAEVAKVLGDMAADRIFFLQDNMGLEKIGITQGPDRHPLYPDRVQDIDND
jgi:hypothetical protein